jgi:formylglycine-generating enzyme required for sulfatase activity
MTPKPILALVAGAMALAVAIWPVAVAARSPAPGLEFRDCPECPRMVRLPGGIFQMGDAHTPARPDEQPVHAVTIAAFAVGKFEVTRREFAAFVAATGYAPGPGCVVGRHGEARWVPDPTASWRDPGYPISDDQPVVCVAWADASAYAAWLTRRTGKSYRLLSEAEFEYAIRAGTTTEYWWGDNPDDLCAYANGGDLAAQKQFRAWPAARCDDGHAFTAPVGSYRHNAFGLYDMAGNAWEWTADCYAPTYDPQPRDGSPYTGGGCEHRVLRGGSMGWGVVDLRSSQRNGLLPPTIRGGDIGFRVARSL